MWVPARCAAPATPAAKAVGPIVGREGAWTGRGNSHLSSLGHSKFKLTPFSRLGGSRCLGLCVHPVTALCPLSLAALLSASFFFKPCLFLYLFVSVYVCVSLFLIILVVSISLQLSTWLCPSASVSLSVFVSPSLYISLPRLVSLYKCLSVTVFISVSPFPFSFYSYSLACCLGGRGGAAAAAVQWDSLGTTLGTAWGPLPGHLHMPVTSASVFPLQLWGVEGAPGREHSAQHLLWIPGSPDPLCLY